MPEKSSSRRVRSGLAISAVVVCAIILGGWFWLAFVLAFMLIGFSELENMMQAIKIKPSRLIFVVLGISMLLVAMYNNHMYLPPLITLTVVASFVRLLFRTPQGTIADIGGTLLATFYVGYLPAHYILLRNMGAVDATGASVPFYLQPGLGYVFMILFVIAFSDIFAYYVGKSLGKHPLHPTISPKKTREGAIGGILMGIVAGVSVGYVIGLPPHHSAILSVILIVAGQLGDLSESMLKRDAGVKDSGNILQGHGGILDRADSYIFSGAFSYYYIYWIVLKQGLSQDILNFLHQLQL